MILFMYRFPDINHFFTTFIETRESLFHSLENRAAQTHIPIPMVSMQIFPFNLKY